MAERCEICSTVGFYCSSESNSSGRQVYTAETAVPIVGLDQSITDCRVVHSNTLSRSDTRNGDTVRAGEQTLDLEGLATLIIPLINAGLIPPRGYERIQAHANGTNYGRAVLDAIQSVVRQINDGQETSKRRESPKETVASALQDPSLCWLIDQEYAVQTSMQLGAEYSIRGDLRVSMTERMRSLLPRTSNFLRVQLESDPRHVGSFLQNLASKCARTKNKLILERDPFKQPYVVVCGKDTVTMIAAHSTYQILAQVVHHNQGNEQEALFEVISTIPNELLFAMQEMVDDSNSKKKLPSFIKEISWMLMILDGFSKRVQISKKSNGKPHVDARVELILMSIAEASQAASLQVAPRSRFAPAQF